ncbi:molybdenum cofactor biosynthesis protein MoaE [Actinotalea subterranea]|uniref:molybdenum cofactor biosynthesis protein MoaE n=1 Tax=Actinotalea subterranea TaxID=2607497 RepID=UPI0011EE7270|nr:molybdenum cofactor biosynthesis protein MoaE [Actinotalea subterranea]
MSGPRPAAPTVPDATPAPGGVRLASVTGAALDVAAHVDAVQHPAAGAVATFVGQVRDHDPSVSGEVVGLEYTAHPDAAAVLGRLAAETAGRPGVLAVSVSHRTGLLPVGGVAVVAAVATAHRTLAFDECRALVEAVKAQLPVWKREVLADGSHVWVGLE